MSSTILTISGISIPDWSARGIQEKITIVPQAKTFSQTVNGGFVNLSPPGSAFKKYIVELSCEDVRPPALDGIFPGSGPYTINCISEFSYVTSGGSPARAVVPGSSRTEGSLTYYRPSLTNMYLVDYDLGIDEWKAGVRWTMRFQEFA